MTEQYTYLYLPKGEWLSAMLAAFRVADLELTAIEPKAYEYSFTSQRLPIRFLAIRSKEVCTDIADPDTLAKGGFTGSDITREQRIPNRWSFPLYELEPSNAKFPEPKVYLGSTPNLRGLVKNPSVQDLKGTTIYTTYPNITKRFFTENQIPVRIKVRQGTIEGRWRVDRSNGAIVDIVNTGQTMKANEIEIIQSIMRPRVVYIESPLIKPVDQARVDDLRELLEIASSFRKPTMRRR